MAESILSFLIQKVTGTKLWRKFSWISYDHQISDVPFLFYFRACGIAVDGTRVDFPPKSNSEQDDALDAEKVSEVVLLGEELRPLFPDEKAPIDVSAVVSVESDNTNNL